MIPERDHRASLESGNLRGQASVRESRSFLPESGHTAEGRTRADEPRRSQAEANPSSVGPNQDQTNEIGTKPHQIEPDRVS